MEKPAVREPVRIIFGKKELAFFSTLSMQDRIWLQVLGNEIIVCGEDDTSLFIAPLRRRKTQFQENEAGPIETYDHIGDGQGILYPTQKTMEAARAAYYRAVTQALTCKETPDIFLKITKERILVGSATKPTWVDGKPKLNPPKVHAEIPMEEWPGRAYPEIPFQKNRATDRIDPQLIRDICARVVTDTNHRVNCSTIVLEPSSSSAPDEPATEIVSYDPDTCRRTKIGELCFFHTPEPIELTQKFLQNVKHLGNAYQVDRYVPEFQFMASSMGTIAYGTLPPRVPGHIILVDKTTAKNRDGKTMPG